MHPLHLYKYHALGNDYLVLDARHYPNVPSTHTIQTLCNRHTGIGADGIVYGPLPSTIGAHKLRIFNPDGTEAEKSGNGIRIFAQYLYDQSLITHEPVVLESLGGPVVCTVLSGSVTASMGTAVFEHWHRLLVLNDQSFTLYAGHIGNPHCVILQSAVSKNWIQKWGPLIECHPLFPNKTNVQSIRILDTHNLQLEIWERGVGYTLASGTSASFAAAVAYTLGHCQSPMHVHMPGGILKVHVTPDLAVSITSPVHPIARIQSLLAE